MSTQAVSPGRPALRALRRLSLSLTVVLGFAGAMIGYAPAAHADGLYWVQAQPSLNVHNGPYTTNPPPRVNPSLPYGSTVHVWCQYPYGTNVYGSTWWDFLGFDSTGTQHWVTDYYISTPVFNGQSPGLANCASSGLNPFWNY